MAHGKIGHDLDLSGAWWAAWQTWKDGVARVDVHPLKRISVVSCSSSTLIVRYRWRRVRGELRLWDNEVLMGWYRSVDAAVRSKGTIYFVLHRQGMYAWGRWVGMSYDGPVVSGWDCIARTDSRFTT